MRADQTENLNSHEWITTPPQAADLGIELVTYCKLCGCEYRGDPAEFEELIYPACKGCDKPAFDPEEPKPAKSIP